LEKVRENLPKEIEEALKGGDQRTLKDIVITAAEYIVRPNEEVLLTTGLYRQMGEVRDRLFEIFTESIQEKVEPGKIEEVHSAVGHFRNFCGGEGRNEIIPLRDEQVQRLKEIELDVHRKSLAARIGNIASLGAAEMLSRLEKELARLHKDVGNFKHMGGEIDERVFSLRINEAVYSSFVSKITQSVKEGDMRGFSFVFGRLQELIGKGAIEERAETLEALREISLPFIQKSFGRLAGAGDLDNFEALERIAGRILGEDEAGKLSAELEPVKRECYQNRIKQLEIQLKIYGVKSYIGLMRQTEDRLHELKKVVPELVDDSIFEYSQRQAERVITMYALQRESLQYLKSLSYSSISYNNKYLEHEIGLIRLSDAATDDLPLVERLIQGRF